MLTRFLACLALCVPLAALSQYPSQTVRVVVGFPPGGTTDVIGRLVAQGLAERLGGKVIRDLGIKLQ
jgi:tripartite-type tricarboxylate transporter receptor subunit TctC